MWSSGEPSGQRRGGSWRRARRVRWVPLGVAGVVGLGIGAAAGCAVDDRVGSVIEEESEADAPGGGRAPNDGAPNEEASGAASAAGAANTGTAPAGDDDAPAGSVGDLGSAGAASALPGPVAMGAAAAAGASATPGGAGAGGASMSGASGSGLPVPPDNGVPPVCGAQLLANGDFDAGAGAGWTLTYDARAVLLSSADPTLAGTGVTPQSGDFLVWLGGIPNGEYGFKYTTRIAQSVTIPENTTRLTFSGFAWVTQPEPDLPLIDWAVMEFIDPSEPQNGMYEGLWQVELWNEDDVSQGWVPFEVVKTMDLERMRGRTLTLVADSRPDGNGSLNVWLDSLRLEASCE